MLKRAGLVLFMLLTVACSAVHTVPMAPDAGTRLANREITCTKREKPNFLAMTAGKAAFGLLGASAMISAGNDIVNANGIQDPAGMIAEQICAELNHKFQTRQSNMVVTTDAKDVEGICASNPKADLIIDIRTTGWAFNYFPTNWNHYRVIYSASIRLIDNNTKGVIAEGFTSSMPKETDDAPTKEELLANNAEKLKQELKKAADFCVKDFETRILSL